jgi:6-pyruvoyl-tetrahydropterin synthase
MKLIEKIIETKNESEKTKLERFFKQVKSETETQIENLKKENETLQKAFDEDKKKVSNEINDITESIDDYLINIDNDEISNKDSRKEYSKDFICGYINKVLEVEGKNKRVERLESVLNEKLDDNKDSILKLQSLLNELK